MVTLPNTAAASVVRLRCSRKTRAYMLAAACFLLCACVGNAAPPLQTDQNALEPHNPPLMGLRTDIKIGEVEGISLHINIAFPPDENTKPRPVLVMIHGGGLRQGAKDQLNARIEAMAEKGIIAASVMYRLAPEHRYPAAVEDVKTAIRFLKARAAEYNLDPDRIIVSGASSGGYLATMIGVTGNASQFSDHGLFSQYDSSVRAVISYSGHIGDFTKAKYQDFPIIERFANVIADDRNAALAAISPLTYLDPDDPPFFLVHGDADERVPVDMTREFTQALDALGHTYTYIEIEGGKHDLSTSQPERSSEAFDAMLKFLERYAFDK